jgi:hypothetical protein
MIRIIIKYSCQSVLRAMKFVEPNSKKSLNEESNAECIAINRTTCKHDVET